MALKENATPGVHSVEIRRVLLLSLVLCTGVIYLNYVWKSHFSGFAETSLLPPLKSQTGGSSASWMMPHGLLLLPFEYYFFPSFLPPSSLSVIRSRGEFFPPHFRSRPFMIGNLKTYFQLLTSWGFCTECFFAISLSFSFCCKEFSWQPVSFYVIRGHRAGFWMLVLSGKV